MQPKSSLGIMVPLAATQSVFKSLVDNDGNKELGEENSSRLLTERSSAVFGGNGRATNLRLPEESGEEHKRPPMFPPSDAEEEETKADGDNTQTKVAVPRAKQKI